MLEELEGGGRYRLNVNRSWYSIILFEKGTYLGATSSQVLKVLIEEHGFDCGTLLKSKDVGINVPAMCQQ